MVLFTKIKIMDNLTKEQRSKLMSKIKSKWTTQEKKVHNYLKGNAVKHKMHPKNVPGADLLLSKSNTAVLLNGCFWHGCKKHFRAPKSNVLFWDKKIKGNLRRDKEVKARLKKNGFRILVIWEHELKSDFKKAMVKLLGVK